MEPEMQPGMESYEVIIVPHIRQFLNSRETKSLDVKWTMKVDTSEDLVSELWLYCQQYFKREIIIHPVEKTIVFSEKELPEFEDLGKFIKIRDQIAKQTFEIIDITDRRIQECWSDGRELALWIFPHSFSIVYRSQWDAIHKGPNALIKETPTDKSGAPSESAINDLVCQLKEYHRLNYSGRYIHWRAWAEYLLKKGTGDQQTIIKQPPPRGILKLFESARSNAEDRFLSIRENVGIASGVNDGIAMDVRDLTQSFQNIVMASEAKLAAEKVFMEKLNALEQKLSNNRENLELFATATRPVENLISKEYLNDIGEQDDVDHYTDDELEDDPEIVVEVVNEVDFGNEVEVGNEVVV